MTIGDNENQPFELGSGPVYQKMPGEGSAYHFLREQDRRKASEVLFPGQRPPAREADRTVRIQPVYQPTNLEESETVRRLKEQYNRWRTEPRTTAAIHETFLVPLDELRGFSARCIGREHPVRAGWFSDRITVEMTDATQEGQAGELATVCVRYRKR